MLLPCTCYCLAYLCVLLPHTCYCLAYLCALLPCASKQQAAECVDGMAVVLNHLVKLLGLQVCVYMWGVGGWGGACNRRQGSVSRVGRLHARCQG